MVASFDSLVCFSHPTLEYIKSGESHDLEIAFDFIFLADEDQGGGKGDDHNDRTQN